MAGVLVFLAAVVLVTVVFVVVATVVLKVIVVVPWWQYKQPNNRSNQERTKITSATLAVVYAVAVHNNRKVYVKTS